MTRGQESTGEEDRGRKLRKTEEGEVFYLLALFSQTSAYDHYWRARY